MAAITAMVAGAAAAATAVSGIAQNNALKRQGRRQEAQMRKQETAAKEAAKLDTTREETGADVQLGTTDTPARKKAAGTAKRKAVGGVLPANTPSKRIGI